jgi:Phage protein Gp138 N-terminal domain
LSDGGRQGFQDSQSTGSEFNTMAFIVKQMIGRIGTSTVVKVVAVSNNGALAPAGTVDVIPLVNQVDGEGKAVPHGTIHGLPYSRMHGGTNAVIMDPVVGDMGIVVFASRDISSVKANKGAANPGSSRRNDFADGMYVGGLLNGTPNQFVQFSGGGITLTSPVKVTVHAPDIALEGNVAATGTFTSNGHDISSTHQHTFTQPGGGLSGVPQ